MKIGYRPLALMVFAAATAMLCLVPVIAEEAGSNASAGEVLQDTAAPQTASGSGGERAFQGEMVGEVTAIRKVSLAFKVPGRLAKVPFFSGDMATDGAEVATLDDRDYRLAVSQAQASLEISRIKVKQLDTGSRPEERRAATENLNQAKANRDNSQAECTRNRDLFKVGAVSQQTLDAAEAKAKVAEAQYLAALQQKSLVDQGPRAEEKESARAAVKQQEASVELAKLQLEYTVLKAPFSGVIAQRHLDEGAFVNSANPVYTIVQLDPVFVVVDFPERFLPGLNLKMIGTVTLDALPGRRFTGKLLRLPGIVDSKTRTARLEFSVDNPDHLMKPGMFARVRLTNPAEMTGPETGDTR